MKKLFNVLSLFLMGVSFILPFLTFMAPYVYGITLHVILSESMKPAIDIGDVVGLDRDIQPAEIRIGDVIAFRQPDVSVPITHRVVEIIQTDTGLGYKTKGDASEDRDVWTVTEDQVLGKVIFRVPRLGYVTRLVKRRYGYNLLVVLPGILLVFLEAKDLLNTKRSSIRKADWFRGADRTTAYLFLAACIIVMGVLQGLISRNVVKTPLTAFEFSLESEEGTGIAFARIIRNESPFPLVICLLSEKSLVTFSQERIWLSPGAQERVVMWSEKPKEATVITAGFLPTLPQKMLSRILAWNTQWAPMLTIVIPCLPITIVGFALMGGFASRPDRRTRRRELRRRFG
jgi:signal peptidase